MDIPEVEPARALHTPSSPGLHVRVFMFSDDLHSVIFVHHNFDLKSSRYRTSLLDAPL